MLITPVSELLPKKSESSADAAGRNREHRWPQVPSSWNFKHQNDPIAESEEHGTKAHQEHYFFFIISPWMPPHVNMYEMEAKNGPKLK